MTPRRERVREALRERRKRVNDAFPEELPVREPERLYEASRHLLDAGGKRLRPTLVLLIGESLAGVDAPAPYREFPDLDRTEGGDGGTIDLMTAAISVEVVHLFTLIHDDIMDDDDLRRGAPAVHRAYDLETAILAGDTLYSKAFELMLRTGASDDRTVRALETLATTCTRICEGQAFDVAFERRDDVTVEEYLDMIELKTAVLYGAAASVPAILLGAEERTVDALYRFGVDIGKGFQIQDDLLDLVASSDEMGKRRGSDLVEDKRTVVTIHAAQQGVDVGSLVGDDPTEAEIDEAVDRLDRAGSIDHARGLAREFVTGGKDRLEVLPDGEPRDLLAEIADYFVERTY